MRSYPTGSEILAAPAGYFAQGAGQGPLTPAGPPRPERPGDLVNRRHADRLWPPDFRFLGYSRICVENEAAEELGDHSRWAFQRPLSPVDDEGGHRLAPQYRRVTTLLAMSGSTWRATPKRPAWVWPWSMCPPIRPSRWPKSLTHGRRRLGRVGGTRRRPWVDVRGVRGGGGDLQGPRLTPGPPLVLLEGGAG